MFFSDLKLLENKNVSFNWITHYKKTYRTTIKYVKWPRASTSKERIKKGRHITDKLHNEDKDIIKPEKQNCGKLAAKREWIT